MSGRRFRSIGESLYRGVTERRREEGNAGSSGREQGERGGGLSRVQADGGKTKRKKKEKTVDTKQGDRLTTSREEAVCVMLQ